MNLRVLGYTRGMTGHEYDRLIALLREKAAEAHQAALDVEHENWHMGTKYFEEAGILEDAAKILE